MIYPKTHSSKNYTLKLEKVGTRGYVKLSLTAKRTGKVAWATMGGDEDFGLTFAFKDIANYMTHVPGLSSSEYRDYPASVWNAEVYQPWVEQMHEAAHEAARGELGWGLCEEERWEGDEPAYIEYYECYYKHRDQLMSTFGDE